MRLLIVALVLIFVPVAVAAQGVPDLSGVTHNAEMVLTYSPGGTATCDPRKSGWGAPDYTVCEDPPGGGFQHIFETVDLATCTGLIASMIAMQKSWDKELTARAGVADPDLTYTGACQCKGGGTTGC